MVSSDAGSQKGGQHVEHPLASHQFNVEEAVEIATGAYGKKYSLWTLSMLRLYGCLLIGYLCATVNGFDGAVMGYVSAAIWFLKILTKSSSVESML